MYESAGATHDWIADHAVDLLPDAEKAWLLPHKRLYLLGTEAPDNRNIPVSCGAPNSGDDDRGSGHSVEWKVDLSDVVEDRDRAARRAQEEYNKAVIAFLQGEPAAAAFYLGAMAHYIGDVSQYGHAWPDEVNHSNYEGWAATRTDSFSEGVFESYLVRTVRRERQRSAALEIQNHHVVSVCPRGENPFRGARRTVDDGQIDTVPIAHARKGSHSARYSFVLPRTQMMYPARSLPGIFQPCSNVGP